MLMPYVGSRLSRFGVEVLPDLKQVAAHAMVSIDLFGDLVISVQDCAVISAS